MRFWPFPLRRQRSGCASTSAKWRSRRDSRARLCCRGWRHQRHGPLPARLPSLQLISQVQTRLLCHVSRCVLCPVSVCGPHH